MPTSEDNTVPVVPEPAATQRTAPGLFRQLAEPLPESPTTVPAPPGNPSEHRRAFLALVADSFAVADLQQFEIILGVAAAHYVPGEMVWLRVFGASRSGKTELLKALLTCPGVEPLEVVTPAAVKGGLKGGNKVLKRIDGALVVTKDLAAILASKREARNELFGVLRNVKDGELVSDFGTEQGDDSHLRQKAQFDWIMATTPAFAQHRALDDLLGARFLDLRWVSGPREEAALKAAQNNPKLPEIRKRLARQVQLLLVAAKAQQARLPNNLEEISRLADLTALARSPVLRDRNGDIRAVPTPELGTEAAQGFGRVAQGLTLLGIDDPMPYLLRLARDSIPDIRLAVLLTLPCGIRELSGQLQLPERTIERALEDLRLLGLVGRPSRGHYHVEPRYRVRVEAIRYNPPAFAPTI